MYTIADYVGMIADRARVQAYVDALRAQITPGMHVLDVGAGFGFFAVVAAQAGAAHVDAVDTNPAIHLGPRVAAANGCADRIAFHHRDARLVTLDRPADLLVCDLRGPTPFGRRAIEVIVQSRSRLLRPGGRIIATRDTLVMAPTRAPAGAREERRGADLHHTVRLEPVQRLLDDIPMRYTIAAEDLVAPGRPWLTIDYGSVCGTVFDGEAQWTCAASARVDGLAAWFEADLGAGIRFSTEPGGGIDAYQQLFVPFRTPVDVAAGDWLRAKVGVRQVRESYLWDWRIWHTPAAEPREREVVRQNSMAELVVDPEAFAATASEATPSLGDRGQALRELLGRIDGRRSVAALAADLTRRAPRLFEDAASAMEFVAAWIHALDRLERGGE